MLTRPSNPQGSYARAGIDFTAIATAFIVLLQLIMKIDFNPSNEPEDPAWDNPVHVDPQTGTRYPSTAPRPPAFVP